jgi:hypothetical protein
MAPNNRRTARRERLALISAVIRGLVAGATRALLDWIIETVVD